MNPVWKQYGACHDYPTAMFFPDNDFGPAKTVCAACPVRQQCLDHALTEGETDGVWGGLTPRERRRSQHGLRRYNNGCRCWTCRKAKSGYDADSRARRATQPKATAS